MRQQARGEPSVAEHIMTMPKGLDSKVALQALASLKQWSKDSDGKAQVRWHAENGTIILGKGPAIVRSGADPAVDRQAILGRIAHVLTAAHGAEHARAVMAACADLQKPGATGPITPKDVGVIMRASRVRLASALPGLTGRTVSKEPPASHHARSLAPIAPGSGPSSVAKGDPLTPPPLLGVLMGLEKATPAQASAGAGGAPAHAQVRGKENVRPAATQFKPAPVPSTAAPEPRGAKAKASAHTDHKGSVIAPKDPSMPHNAQRGQAEALLQFAALKRLEGKNWDVVDYQPASLLGGAARFKVVPQIKSWGRSGDRIVEMRKNALDAVTATLEQVHGYGSKGTKNLKAALPHIFDRVLSRHGDPRPFTLAELHAIISTAENPSGHLRE